MAIYFQKREIVVPGQLLAEGRYRSSIGTYSKDGKIYASLIGLAELRGNTIKVVPLEGVYIPREGDLVIGIITLVAGNNWKVDIGGPYGASLHANNALRRPYDEDISKYFDVGDVIAAEVIAFDRVSGPFLTMRGRGLQKLRDGMILNVSPSKIPRIIGRRGSMINMIKDKLRIYTIVGQNGRIWIKAPNTKILRIAIKAFKMIEREAHTSKLTDRVAAMIDEELTKIRGEQTEVSGAVPEEKPEEPPTEAEEKAPEPEGSIVEEETPAKVEEPESKSDEAPEAKIEAPVEEDKEQTEEEKEEVKE